MKRAHNDVSQYTPHIPLLTEPAFFMALVPADKAMEVTRAIKEKYEREMSKVRDRLPLHLGVVIAPRRTPLRAVLEAGRAMLEREGTSWEKWEVAKKPGTKEAGEAPAHLVEGNQHFASWWDVPLRRNGRAMDLRIGAVMGDGKTDDRWYAHLLTREPKPKNEDFADQPWSHPAELEQGDEVWIAPSTFDFEFLDTTARRFEIAYDEHGRRRGRLTRPFLLDDVEVLQEVWGLISQRLTTSQWMALESLIEQKRREWDEPWGMSEGYSPAFECLVHDALCNAEWKWKVDGAVEKGWGKLNEKEQDLLERAALQGVLSDAINLYHEAMKMKGKREEA